VTRFRDAGDFSFSAKLTGSSVLFNILEIEEASFSFYRLVASISRHSFQVDKHETQQLFVTMSRQTGRHNSVLHYMSFVRDLLKTEHIFPLRDHSDRQLCLKSFRDAADKTKVNSPVSAGGYHSSELSV